ncbi:ATP-binding cassette domain-containing protein [Microbacterium sp. 22296]|uniref:ABC transporter ATP-binding protein n=1 Tax=Microbacterium sp. 22296 TaxID=3453903 RepID=UPI003F867552
MSAAAGDEVNADAAIVPEAASAEAVDARVTADGSASPEDAASTPTEHDDPASPDAADTPVEVVSLPSEEPAPTVDSPAGEADPMNPDAADPDLASPEGASPLAFDDIVIPPRPPLPVAPAAEAPVSHAIDERIALDPTPADVAVEEPVIADPLTAEPSADERSTALEETAAQDDPGPLASDVEVVVETPLDTRDDTDEQPATSDVPDDATRGVDEAAASHDVPGDGAADVTSSDDRQDPTPPDVRADDDAPADETSDALALDASDAEVEAPSTVAAATAVMATHDDASADSAPGAAVSADGATDTAASTDPEAGAAVPALTLRHITKTFGELRAVDAIDLTVPAGSFYGLVGPNGAGKTTTLSIIAGLLRADGGAVTINGVDAKKRAREAKKMIGVLPDRLRTFDRLTGRQLLSYYGALRGLPSGLVESRMADLARAFDLVDALARPVSDYSAGMTKKVMLAGAMIHSPRLLVLDEPFEAVDPVSSGVILDILRTYVDHGGTVILSSHGMELVERVCSRVAVIVSGQVLAEGTIDEVRGEGTLEQRFRELSGGLGDVEGLEWLHTFSA